MSNRLTKQDWVAHGFEVLKTEGHGGLKADRMVKALKVSRGSFYWHFKDIDDFETCILEAWRTDITEAVIAELKTLPDGTEQIRELIQRVLTIPQGLEAAIRLWSGQSEKVARAVAEVDRLRIDYLTNVLEGLGLPPGVARPRAAILAWAYIGRSLSPAFADGVTEHAARDLSFALTTPEIARKDSAP
ncbi:TetR/AcrR family transcriptional regulator [Hoeflea prorocentri]|uniref:TetR/AcrR family transcriptional regulator n=1 Tax=Hoeflea prorocentri TaxID=1922333 RepID=A0A9X3ZJ16_9HYPH|nr:TetR/AcrR family transcriptional regulator [Hoeflea prorocentri]MCY6382320.1 TetR/AcrR family transcriptional regulator [Hoeflea prorocentri]MDA5400120.1 TetR/AcrR family transcriptional regulator [Hoeflea prorocentri]